MIQDLKEIVGDNVKVLHVLDYDCSDLGLWLRVRYLISSYTYGISL